MIDGMIAKRSEVGEVKSTGWVICEYPRAKSTTFFHARSISSVWYRRNKLQDPSYVVGESTVLITWTSYPSYLPTRRSRISGLSGALMIDELPSRLPQSNHLPSKPVRPETRVCMEPVRAAHTRERVLAFAPPIPCV